MRKSQYIKFKIYQRAIVVRVELKAQLSPTTRQRNQNGEEMLATVRAEINKETEQQ